MSDEFWINLFFGGFALLLIVGVIAGTVSWVRRRNHEMEGERPWEKP